jgi:hypothetical protein
MIRDNPKPVVVQGDKNSEDQESDHNEVYEV